MNPLAAMIFPTGQPVKLGLRPAQDYEMPDFAKNF